MPTPIVPPPSNDIGAITWPRRLQRWLDVNRITKLDRVGTFVTLPSFTQSSNTWNGYSDIVEAFNCESPNSCSLLGVTTIVPSNPNFVLTISYRVGETLTRYLIWDATGSNLNQSIPLYSGQPLKKNWRFEVWNTAQGAASLNAAITFTTSVLGKVDYRWGTDSALVTADVPCTNFGCLNPTASSPSVTGVDWWKYTGLIFAGGTYITWNSTAGTGSVTQYSGGFPWPTQNYDGSANLSSTALNFNLSSTSEAVTNFFLIVWPNANGSWNLINNAGTQLIGANCSNTNVSGISSAGPIFSITFASQPLCYGIAGTLVGTTLTITVYDIRGNILGTQTVVVTNLTLKLIQLGLIHSVYEVIVSSNTFNFADYMLANYGSLHIPLPLTFPSNAVSQTN